MIYFLLSNSDLVNHKNLINQPMRQSNQEQRLYQSILCKFIINLPTEQRQDCNRLAYQIQKAFYYYLDYVLCISQIPDWQNERNQFVAKLAQYAPTSIRIDTRKITQKFMLNKPVCGAIIFNKQSTKVLVIRVKNKFGFPKGKWNQHQLPQECAAREVQEQTGVYIHNHIDPNIKIQFESHGSPAYFFVVRGISEDDRLKRDAKQIDDIFWMRVEDIKSNIMKFAQRSRLVWKHYESLQIKKETKQEESVLSFQGFLKKYKPQAVLTNTAQNPFLNFKLDRERLKQVLLEGWSDQ